MRILCAEPSLGTCLALEALLEGQNHTCSFIHEADSLLKELALERPDVLILDTLLDSDELIALLETIHQHHPEIYILLTTSSDFDPDIRKIPYLRVAGTLRKPFGFEELIGILSYVEKKLSKSLDQPIAVGASPVAPGINPHL